MDGIRRRLAEGIDDKSTTKDSPAIIAVSSPDNSKDNGSSSSNSRTPRISSSSSGNLGNKNSDDMTVDSSKKK